MRKRKKKPKGMEEILEGVEVVAQTLCHPSESLEKVREALGNVLEGEIDVEERGEETYLLTARGRGFQGIKKIYHGFRNRQVLAAVRKHLKSRVEEGKITFLLNKEAAYVGVISISEAGESDLGAIRVSIRSPDAMELIMWMTRF
ncbi:MAG: RNA-binding domain-containing protein [Candidatus Geothermarchaeales archaeon]